MYYLPASFSLAFLLREYKRELNFVTILRLHQTDTQQAAKGRLVGSRRAAKGCLAGSRRAAKGCLAGSRQAAFLHPADAFSTSSGHLTDTQRTLFITSVL